MIFKKKKKSTDWKHKLTGTFVSDLSVSINILRRMQWQPTPVLLPGKSHGRSLIGNSPWGRLESDTTEQLHFHFSLSCIGEGNGNPLQCSCLENPRDGGSWWAAILGVAQSRTRLKWLSSSSSSSINILNVHSFWLSNSNFWYLPVCIYVHVQGHTLCDSKRKKI